MEDKEFLLNYLANNAQIDANNSNHQKLIGWDRQKIVDTAQELIEEGYVHNPRINHGGNNFILSANGEEFYRNGGYIGIENKKRDEQLAYELRELNIKVSKSTLALHKFQRRSGNISIFISSLAFLVAAGALMIKVYELKLVTNMQLKEPPQQQTQTQISPHNHIIIPDSLIDSSYSKINNK